MTNHHRDEDMASDDYHWHLDKKIPVVVIFMLFMQTFGAVWFASNLNSRVDRLEEKIVVTERLSEMVIRLDEQSKSTVRILEKISDAIIKGSD